MNRKRVTLNQKGLERFAQNTYQPIIPNWEDKYFWVYGITKGGKRILWSSDSEIDASRKLATLEDGEVFELDTRNETRATREIKAILLERGAEPDEVLRRLSHKKDD